MRLLLLPLLFLVVVHGQYITVPNFPFIDESLLPSELSRLGLATAAYSGSSKDFSTQLLEGDAEKRGWDVYPVFLRLEDDESPEDALEQSIESINNRFAPFVSLLSRNCGRSMLAFLTALSLPPSYRLNADFSRLGIDAVFLPGSPSKRLCEDLQKHCSPAFLPAPILDELIPGGCDAKVNISFGDAIVFPEQDLFPEESSEFIIGGIFNTFIPATSYGVKADYDVVCQSPLRFNKEAWRNNERPCQDYCLGYVFYTENQWDSAHILTSVLSWICLVSNLNLMIVLLIMSSKNRKYPGFLSVCMCICGIFIALPFVVSSIGGYEEILCEDDFTPATFDYGPCVWSACFFIWGALLGALTWASLAVNTYVTIHLRWKINNDVWGLVTYIIIFGYPTLAIIIGLATEDFAYTPPIPWCWWKSTGQQWGLFYWVIILCSLIVIWCMIFVLFEFRNIQDSSKRKRAKYLKALRVAAFLLLFLEIAVAMITAQSIFTAREDQYLQNTGAYIGCLYANVEQCERPPDGEGALSAAQWYWLLANASGVGLPVAFVFGTTAPVFFFWCNAARNAHEGKDIAPTSDTGTGKKSSWIQEGSEESQSYDPDDNA